MGALLDKSMTFSPHALRLNPSPDSDIARQMWEFAQKVAEAGKPLVMSAAEETFSPSEVAAMLGVSTSTVQRHIADGTLKAHRRGTYWRVPDSEVDRYSRWMASEVAAILMDDGE